LSFIILFYKIKKYKSCLGISLKSQELYALVFTARYFDLIFDFSYFYKLSFLPPGETLTPPAAFSLYNIAFKLAFLFCSYAIVFLIRFNHGLWQTYDRQNDWIPVIFLIAPCAVLAFVWNDYFDFVGILWAFSIYLEAVAIFPQLMLLQGAQQVGSLTYDYVFALGGYRALYLINWIYRIYTEPGYSNWIAWIAGIVQTTLYSDFFYQYIVNKRSSILPTKIPDLV